MACPRGLRHFRAYGGVGEWGGIRTSFILRPCPKHRYLQRLRLFVQQMQGCGTRKSVTGVHAFCDHAQNIGIYSHFASLHNMLRKDVEQEVGTEAISVLHSYAVLSAFVQGTLILPAGECQDRKKVEAEVRCQLTPKPQIEHKSK